jgi:hypothetical protein
MVGDDRMRNGCHTSRRRKVCHIKAILLSIYGEQTGQLRLATQLYLDADQGDTDEASKQQLAIAQLAELVKSRESFRRYREHCKLHGC